MMRHMPNLPSLFIQALDRYATLCVATADTTGTVDCASVFFAHDGNTLYFATAAGTTKADNLGRRANVAMATDDRNTTGVQLRGLARALQGGAAAEARRLLLERHPKIEKFLDKPGTVFFAVKPTERFLINFAWGVDWRLTVED